MTHKILRKNFTDNDVLEKMIQDHLTELRSYDAHEVMVREGSAEHYPPPQAHPDIDQAIRRDPRPNGTTKFTSDYEVVDYLPVSPGDQIAFDHHKKLLVHNIQIMEEQSIHALHPLGKWRLANLQYQNSIGKKEDERTITDNEIISEHNQRREIHSKIQLHYAEIQARIEDLTFDTINDFVLVKFEG